MVSPAALVYAHTHLPADAARVVLSVPSPGRNRMPFFNVHLHLQYPPGANTLGRSRPGRRQSDTIHRLKHIPPRREKKYRKVGASL